MWLIYRCKQNAKDVDVDYFLVDGIWSQNQKGNGRMQSDHILLSLTDIVWNSIKLLLKTDIYWIPKIQRRRKKLNAKLLTTNLVLMEARNFGPVNPLLRADNIWDPIKLEDTLVWQSGSPTFLLVFLNSFHNMFDKRRICLSLSPFTIRRASTTFCMFILQNFCVVLGVRESGKSRYLRAESESNIHFVKG